MYDEYGVSTSIKFRKILFEWLLEIQQLKKAMRVANSTFFCSLAIFDSFVEKWPQAIKKSELQGYGMACYIVAAWLYDRQSCCLKDFQYICDNAYTNYRIGEFVTDVLNTFEFDFDEIHSEENKNAWSYITGDAMKKELMTLILEAPRVGAGEQKKLADECLSSKNTIDGHSDAVFPF